MIKLIRKYQKQSLAVFGVLLMIIFILPQSFKNGRSITRRAIGHIGKEAVYADEKSQAASDWRILKSVDGMIPFSPVAYDPQRIDPAPHPAMYIYKVGAELADELDKNPELYLLLQREAQQRGISVSPQQVEAVIQTELFQDFDGHRLQVAPERIGTENYQALSAALARFLPVVALVNRVESDVKYTEPMAQHEMAEEQLVQLNIVDFPAANFQKSIADPTPQQLQQQYDKFRDVIAPGADPTSDPLGFGYKLPDRVKVQYLTIRHADVVKAVRATKSAYEWHVQEATLYYHDHPDGDFQPPPSPATAPTSQPATTQVAAATQPAATQVASTTNPTTRPSDEERAQIEANVMAKPIADLTQAIQSALSARLAADLKARGSAATTAPAADLASKAYLESVALDIQKKLGVLPAVTQRGDWLDAAALAQLPGIGEASADEKPFVSLAMPAAEPGAAPPALLEPSPFLNDTEGNLYLFRITQRDPSHTPALGEVAAKVTADYRLGAAYAAAGDAAKKLLDSANKIGLASAAAAQNLPVLSTAAFDPGSREPIPKYSLSPQSLAVAGAKAAELRSAATADKPHPLAVAELPADKKVALMQLAGLSSRLRPDDMYIFQLTRSIMLSQQLGQRIVARYFSYDAVKARLNYVPVEASPDTAGL